jgi:GDPmannose 4,6-dehydratase
MVMKAALITGVTGQDGSYLAELLLAKDYDVYGMARYCSEKKHERIEHLKSDQRFRLVEGDLTDTSRITSIINSFQNYNLIEVYNLGAQSHVKVSFDQPEFTANVDALGTLRILEAIRQTGFSSKFKFYQAGTSEMFGKIQDPVQSETTPFYPRSPYGVSKLFSFWITKNYRESYDMFACTGILFNHESERRGTEFVTRKITLGLDEWRRTGRPLELGNLDAKRDWGHAQDYVEAMWLMLQRPEPDDFVIGTGETHSIREFVEEACREFGMKIEWSGEGTDEVGKTPSGHVVVKVNPAFYRPAEVDVLIADATKARTVLGWTPKVSFKDLVKRMITHDCNGVALCGPESVGGYWPSDESVC